MHLKNWKGFYSLISGNDQFSKTMYMVDLVNGVALYVITCIVHACVVVFPLLIIIDF